MRAVRFNDYGDVDVLDVVEVPDPVAAEGQVLVRVKAAGINPGEAAIRRGDLKDRWPATFPSGEGSDLAGTVEQVGAGVERWSAGEEVIGFTNERASHAELVLVDAQDLTPKPAAVSWDAGGGLFVAGVTAWAAVRAVGAGAGDVVVVAGATVIGLASEQHHSWLREHGAIPVEYGDGAQERVREAAGGRVDALVDTYGSGYVDMGVELGIAPARIDTIIDYGAAARHGAKTDASAAGASAEVLAQLAQLIADGKLEIPIAHAYPLAEVRAAFRELEARHTLGKIVLHPNE